LKNLRYSRGAVDTFELLPVLAAGHLSQTSAPELVAAIYRSRASGTLSVEGESKEEIRLFFKAGNPCGAARPAGFRSLAEILLAQKMLSTEQAERAAAEASARGKRLGEVLLSMGILLPEQLHLGLALQHRENLRLLLLRNVGGYEWRGWEPPPVWAGEVTVDPVRAILEALALPQHAGRRTSVMRWLGDAQVRASVDFAEVAAQAEFVVSDRRAAELFASPLPPESFFASAGLPLPRAEALLVALLLVGGVEPVPSEASQPLDASLFEPRPPEPPEDAGEPESHELQAVAVPQEQRDPVEDLAAELAAELGDAARRSAQIEAAAQAAVAQEEAARLARAQEAQAEPLVDEPLADEPLVDEPLAEAPLVEDVPIDEPHHDEPPAEKPRPQTSAPLDASELFGDTFPGSADPEPMSLAAGPGVPLGSAEDLAGPAPERVLDLVEPPSLHETPVDPFASKRVRSGTEFMFDGGAADPMPGLELSMTPQEAQADDRGLRKKLLSQGLRNLGRAPVALELEGEEPQQARELREELQPPPLTDEEKAFLSDARARVKIAPKQDAYARLGVPQTAPQEQIRTAYLLLVKKFHPDRAQSSPGLILAQAELQTLFGLLRDAYERVGSREARAEYDASGRQDPKAQQQLRNRADEARLSMKKGEVFLKKRDHESAMRELRRAVDLDPSAEALSLLAWGLVSDRNAQAATRDEALNLVTRALKADLQNARAHYVAGVLKRTTEPESALMHFKHCVELDPRNADAALELRLLERRREKKPITGPLTKLFKRDGK
jgi:curved DNA-binding protein CbpA